jgi:hypothetical protein
MEKCDKCGGQADYICPDCGKKYCKPHMEQRYAGPDRGFKSRHMCPSCWKKKQLKLSQDMVNVKQHKPKTYVYGN